LVVSGLEDAVESQTRDSATFGQFLTELNWCLWGQQVWLHLRMVKDVGFSEPCTFHFEFSSALEALYQIPGPLGKDGKLI